MTPTNVNGWAKFLAGAILAGSLAWVAAVGGVNSEQDRDIKRIDRAQAAQAEAIETLKKSLARIEGKVDATLERVRDIPPHQGR